MIQKPFRDKFRHHATDYTYGITEDFERKYAQHPGFPENIQAKVEQRGKDRIRAQSDILRSDWQRFLGATFTGDLEKIFRNSARQSGRTQQHYGPPCLDPMRAGQKLVLRPAGNEKTLARYFADRPSESGTVAKGDGNPLRRELRARYRGGHWRSG